MTRLRRLRRWLSDNAGPLYWLGVWLLMAHGLVIFIARLSNY